MREHGEGLARLEHDLAVGELAHADLRPLQVGHQRHGLNDQLNQFLVDLPADDRLSETRRIMHKDLHRH